MAHFLLFKKVLPRAYSQPLVPTFFDMGNEFHNCNEVFRFSRCYSDPSVGILYVFLVDLISIAASTSTPSYSRNNSAQSQSDADDPLGTDFIARIDSPTLDETGSNSSDPRLVSRGQFASQNQTGLQNALEDKDRLLRAAAIYSDYQVNINQYC